MSGTSTDGREELAKLLPFLRKGDTFVVTRIDRAASVGFDIADMLLGAGTNHERDPVWLREAEIARMQRTRKAKKTGIATFKATKS